MITSLSSRLGSGYMASGSVWRGLSTVVRKVNQTGNHIPLGSTRCARISTITSSSPNPGLPKKNSQASFYMWTDASAKGIGGYYLPHSNQKLSQLDISSIFIVDSTHLSTLSTETNKREAEALLYGLKIFGSQFKGGIVCAYCDNQSVVRAFSKDGKIPKALWQERREYEKICEKWDIKVSTIQIPGVENVLADRLSRMRYNALMKHVPHLNEIWRKHK